LRCFLAFFFLAFALLVLDGVELLLEGLEPWLTAGLELPLGVLLEPGLVPLPVVVVPGRLPVEVPPPPVGVVDPPPLPLPPDPLGGGGGV
jgi:hypothetical protein